MSKAGSEVGSGCKELNSWGPGAQPPEACGSPAFTGEAGARPSLVSLSTHWEGTFFDSEGDLDERLRTKVCVQMCARATRPVTLSLKHYHLRLSFVCLTCWREQGASVCPIIWLRGSVRAGVDMPVKVAVAWLHVSLVQPPLSL